MGAQLDLGSILLEKRAEGVIVFSKLGLCSTGFPRDQHSSTPRCAG